MAADNLNNVQLQSKTYAVAPNSNLAVSNTDRQYITINTGGNFISIDPDCSSGPVAIYPDSVSTPGASTSSPIILNPGESYSGQYTSFVLSAAANVAVGRVFYGSARVFRNHSDPRFNFLQNDAPQNSKIRIDCTQNTLSNSINIALTPFGVGNWIVPIAGLFGFAGGNNKPNNVVRGMILRNGRLIMSGARPSHILAGVTPLSSIPPAANYAFAVNQMGPGFTQSNFAYSYGNFSAESISAVPMANGANVDMTYSAVYKQLGDSIMVTPSGIPNFANQSGNSVFLIATHGATNDLPDIRFSMTFDVVYIYN